MKHTKALPYDLHFPEEGTCLNVQDEVRIIEASHGATKFNASISQMERIAWMLRVEVRSLVRSVMIVGYPNVAAGIDFYEEVRRFEISLIRGALVRSGGQQRGAAILLGLGATTLNAKIKQYEIKVERN